MTRVVFMGTPDFAVPSLEALIADPAFTVAGVVTQPDRPAGRGQQIRMSPVKTCALAHDIPITQPEKLRGDEALAPLVAWAPDVIVVAAFGQLLRAAVLSLPRYGCINVHASLLPRWRGAAPIQYAIREGDAESGVTIMVMEAGLDTGPILLQRAIPLAPDETGASLHDKLAALGADLLIPALKGVIAGAIAPRPQPEEGVTIARSLEKGAGRIDWGQSAAAIDRQVRAYTPWPGSFTTLDGEILKVLGGRVSASTAPARPPGTLLLDGGDMAVATGDGLYVIGECQPAGRRPMTAAAFLAGRVGILGSLLGEEPSGPIS